MHKTISNYNPMQWGISLYYQLQYHQQPFNSFITATTMDLGIAPGNSPKGV